MDMQQIDMLINGRGQAARAKYQRRQPISGEAVTEAAAAEPSEACTAAEVAATPSSSALSRGVALTI
jgi:hypothetical protein